MFSHYLVKDAPGCGQSGPARDRGGRDRKDQVEFSRGAAKATDPQWVPVFSPDGRTLAYKSETRNGKHVIKLADMSEVAVAAHGVTNYGQLGERTGTGHPRL